MSDISSLRQMLKKGVPRGAVEMKCVQAGLDPAQLDEVKVFLSVLSNILIFLKKLTDDAHVLHCPQ